MEKEKITKTILVCDVCDEPLHARVVSQMIHHLGIVIPRHKQELFCPSCGAKTTAFKHFVKQRNEKKENAKT